MKERGILFSAEMVRALLDGQKTQTRRIAKLNAAGRVQYKNRQWHVDDPDCINACPYGVPGDRLWVRETFWVDRRDPGCVIYAADQTKYKTREGNYSVQTRASYDISKNAFWSKKPSIFMPRWASRLTLEITGVRVERLREISGGDAVAEGYPNRNPASFDSSQMIHAYSMAMWWHRCLWESINGKESWDSNPWVWAIEFRKVGNK